MNKPEGRGGEGEEREVGGEEREVGGEEREVGVMREREKGLEIGSQLYTTNN